jgi:hypothetical protein
MKCGEISCGGPLVGVLVSYSGRTMNTSDRPGTQPGVGGRFSSTLLTSIHLKPYGPQGLEAGQHENFSAGPGPLPSSLG